jgi:hypothetical protein
MFENSRSASIGNTPADLVAGWLERLQTLADECADDTARIDLLSALEALKGGAAGTQAAVTADFHTSHTALGNAANTKPDLIGASIRAQVALARRDSAHSGGRHVGVALALGNELPHTRRALREGRISEWQATLICRETACLDPELRRTADGLLADRLGGLGDAALTAAAARVVAELDPAAVTARARKAVGDRRVSVRPAADAMAYLSALLPAATAMACYGALDRHATLTIAEGDPHGQARQGKARGRGQIMADTLTDRLTGGAITGYDAHGMPITAASATAAATPASPTDTDVARIPPALAGPARTAGAAAPGLARSGACECCGGTGRYQFPTLAHAQSHWPRQTPERAGIVLNVIMTDRTLLAGCQEPAELIGYGPIPADIARHLAASSLGPNAKTWVRRFFADPDTGQLAAMDAKTRLFPDTLKQFLLIRDRHCRSPYCSAPGRHADHQTDHANGGPTSEPNGRLTCQACNQVKNAPGWTVTTRPDGTIETTTPTGHTYQSRPPTPPGTRHRRLPPTPETSWAEKRLDKLIIDYMPGERREVVSRR